MFRLPQLSLLLAPVMLSLVTPLNAASPDWRDIESQVQYASYTEDLRELTALASHVMDAPQADPLRGYFLTLVQLRVAQLDALAPTPDLNAIGRAAADCISFADDALAARPTDAELLALQSSCMDLRSRTRSVEVPFTASRSRTQMQRALQLAAKDPRVQLLAAQQSYGAAKTRAERVQQLQAFQMAVNAFEQERQGLEHIPSWGAAEAWLGVAQVDLERGDPIAARAALEHALLLMPEYKAAHRLLNHILTG